MRIADFGKAGDDGVTPTVSINSEGYWVINGRTSSVKAKGDDGAPAQTPEITIKDGYWYVNGSSTNVPVSATAPVITINGDGYWVINGTASTVKAKGEAGKDGTDGTTPTVSISTDGYWEINSVKSSTKATPSTVSINSDGNWTLDGTSTGVSAKGTDGNTWLSGSEAPTTGGKEGDFYLDISTWDVYKKGSSSWAKIGNIKGADGADGADGKDGKDGKDGADGKDASSTIDTKDIGDHTMISDGLSDLAANAVEMVVDENTGIVYAVYLASETALGESQTLVKMAKFNILQPTNVVWTTIFNYSTDFGGHYLSECNIIELNKTTVRVFAVDKSTWTYYYKDVTKSNLAIGDKHEVKFKANDSATPVTLSKSNINSYLSGKSAGSFGELQSTTHMINVDGYYYTTLVGGNNTTKPIFCKSIDGSTWTVVSLIPHKANYECMLAHYDGKFWAMCRDGYESSTTSTKTNLMYSSDGITWTQSNLALTISETRPYLFTFKNELYLAYSSPLESTYSTVRTWRCNVHIGKIVSSGGSETFEEVIYKESKFGIVYYALTEWYGNMVMLYSSGELNPTKGLMSGWSQGKDCVNYTIINKEEPNLTQKTLSSIEIVASPTTTDYVTGDTFDASGLVVKAKYSDNSTSNVTGYTLSVPNMNQTGSQEITVSYTYEGTTKTTKFTITVSEQVKVLQSILVTKNPTETEYLKNASFSSAGLEVKAHFDVGADEVITDYTLSTPDMTTLGTKTITVSYTKDTVTKTTTFDIIVRELSSISVTKDPTTVTYAIGDTFSSSGLEITASYTAGNDRTVTGYTLSPTTVDTSTAGSQTITVSYTEGGITKTTSFNITVASIYTELSGVVANGTQYIDTGLTTTKNTKVVVVMDKIKNGDAPNGKWLIASSKGEEAASKNFGLCLFDSASRETADPKGTDYRMDIGGQRYNVSNSALWTDGKNIIVVGNGVYTINGSSITTVTTENNIQNSTANLYLLQSPNSTGTVYLKGTFYKFSIYEGNTLVMELIPAKRISDNKIGFYDTVGKEFVFSATATDFTAKAD